MTYHSIQANLKFLKSPVKPILNFLSCHFPTQSSPLPSSKMSQALRDWIWQGWTVGCPILHTVSHAFCSLPSVLDVLADTGCLSTRAGYRHSSPGLLMGRSAYILHIPKETPRHRQPTFFQPSKLISSRPLGTV